MSSSHHLMVYSSKRNGVQLQTNSNSYLAHWETAKQGHMNANGLFVPVENRTFLISEEDKLPELTNVVGECSSKFIEKMQLRITIPFGWDDSSNLKMMKNVTINSYNAILKKLDMSDSYNLVWEKLATLILPVYCNDVGQGAAEDTLNQAKQNKDDKIKDFLKFHLPSTILNKDTKDASMM
ncbi:Hypothetical predicted protein [Paramuricea clavata]|uniref:Uncharacterized protein n=1 Tax=Paramuricea clavata TaxID=317549 RepID=A0A7D9DUT1_PARCT|nr:Hypothetical predicted protein [Paramuricea clavata]